MKILYINSLDKRYGSTYRSRSIAKALAGLGHDLTYVESNLDEEISPKSISVKQQDSLLGYFKATCKRARLALRKHYDVLFIQKFIPLTIPCLFIGKFRGKKCIVDWDDLDFCYQTNIVKKMLVFLCEHIFPYFADCITTHSNRLKKYAYAMGLKNVHLVNQIVDFGFSKMSDAGKKQLRLQIGAADRKILCFLGTLTLGGAADLDIIIEAVSRIVSDRNDIFFLIIGGGPLEQRIVDLLNQSKIRAISYITGLIPRQEVQRFLSISGVGLIYMRDNLGNRMRVSFKVLEYLSTGIPVVGYLIGESHDRFSDFCYASSYEGKEFSETITRLFDGSAAKKQFDFDAYSLHAMENSLQDILHRYE